MSSINSLFVAQLFGDQGRNSLITIRPCPVDLSENTPMQESVSNRNKKLLFLVVFCKGYGFLTNNYKLLFYAIDNSNELREISIYTSSY